MTVHKAQGVTVDRASVLLSEQMTSRELAYVAASRSRAETTIFVSEGTRDDLDRLVARSAQKTAALEHIPVPKPERAFNEVELER